MTDPRHRGDGESTDGGSDALEIDFSGPDLQPGQDAATDASAADAGDMWDDLPETEVDEGELDSDFFRDFDAADAEVYDGIPTDEDIATEAARGEVGSEDDVTIEEDDAEIEIEEGAATFFEDEEHIGWTADQWTECAARLIRDARAHEDTALSARLLAEAARITEVRLHDPQEALKLARTAHQLDARCLTAIQCLRRLSIVAGNAQDALEALGIELEMAQDAVVKDRLDDLKKKILHYVASGDTDVGSLSGEDAYHSILALCAALSSGDAARAAESATSVCDAATDSLFVSTLGSSSGLLSEIGGNIDDARRAYMRAMSARDADAQARTAMWRMHVLAREWAEAERVVPFSSTAPTGPVSRGTDLIRALLATLVLDDREKTLDILGRSPAGQPQLIMGLLACAADPVKLEQKSQRLVQVLPAGTLRSVLMYASAGRQGDPGLEELREILDQSPGFAPASLRLIWRLAGRQGSGHEHLLDATIEEMAGLPRTSWLVSEAALCLLSAGRRDQALRVVSRSLEMRPDDELAAAALLSAVAWGAHDQALSLVDSLGVGSPASVIGDALRLIERLAPRKGGEPSAEVKDPLFELSCESPLWPHALAEAVALASAGGPAVDTALLEASLDGPLARSCVPAVLMGLISGMVADSEKRVALAERMLRMEPGHLPAFVMLRRELLASGKVDLYGQVLEDWCESERGYTSEHLDGERIALLSLGARSSLGEDELGVKLARSGDDAFLPLFLVGLGAFPALGAEAAEKLASGADPAAADRWWFEAARRWTGVDPHRASRAIERITDPGWSRAADNLREAAAWNSGRWDDVAGQLLAAYKQIPEGEISVPIISRMVYVDGFLKGETSMALAEAESLLDGQISPGLFCLRFLYTQMLAQGRTIDAARVAEIMARALPGSDEASAFAWLVSRVFDDDARVPRADALVREVLGARASDLPLLFLADAQARRLSNNDLRISVLSELSGALDDPREQGALLWVLALMLAERDPEKAFSAAREASDRLPTNPAAALVVEQLASLREDWATAAMFARQAGSLTREPGFAVDDLLHAGELYRDRLGEGGWAVQCFEQAVTLDPSDDRPFEALRQHFSGLGDWDHVATLLEERILSSEDPRMRHALLRNLGTVYEQAGRVEEAIASFRRILADDPEDASSLESLGALCIRTRQFEEAVNVLQERALLPMTQEQKVHVFTTLGGLYVDQLPDDRKAVVCFEKVLQENVQDLDIIRQLAGLYERTGAWEKGLRMAEIMFNASEEEDAKAEWLVTAGRLWQDGAGDMRKAEQSYEMARKRLPGASEPVVALVNLYRKQADRHALSFHIERSMGDLLHFVRENPGDMHLYHTVFEIARATEDSRAIRVAGTLLASLFDLHPDEQPTFERAGGLMTWQPGAWLSEPGTDEVIAPDSFTPSFRVLVSTLHDALMKSVDYDPKRFGISRGTRLQKRYPQDVALLEDVARNMGIKPLQVHLSDLIPSVLTVLPDSPPLLVIGEPLYRTLDQGQKRFAFAWGCKLDVAGLVPFMSQGEAGLAALWVALMQQFEPSFFISGVDPDQTVKLSASLRKNLPRKAREELFGAGVECSGDQRIDVSRLYADFSNLADRAGLLTCGDIAGALQFVWLVSSGEEPFNSDYTAARALEESGALLKLVEFVISGRFARVLPGAE